MKPSTSTNILTKPWIKSQTKDYNFNLLEQTLKNKVNLPLNSIIMAIGTLLEIYKACATYNNKKDKRSFTLFLLYFFSSRTIRVYQEFRRQLGYSEDLRASSESGLMTCLARFWYSPLWTSIYCPFSPPPPLSRQF